jgi:hypothetical protein
MPRDCGARLNDVCFTCGAPPILGDHLLMIASGPAIPRYDSSLLFRLVLVAAIGAEQPFQHPLDRTACN